MFNQGHCCVPPVTEWKMDEPGWKGKKVLRRQGPAPIVGTIQWTKVRHVQPKVKREIRILDPRRSSGSIFP